MFEAQVEFKGDLATIYFVNGSQLVIRLSQPTIREPNNIVGYRHVGQLPLGRSLSIGIGTDPALTGSITLGGRTLSDTWSIQLLSNPPL